ncbi:hypothetical protein [Microvirga sp. CF3016]|uniref:hypothetical protein n=1 Tax=Microvirga sp. CF3016 TaxID=3110181 RepID=UPI002E7A39EE|nr:hypothetical protein [Microvirga sp. CF3016]MEE1612849.1 hypothetical protein [Microvirga sp. CF3016]
MRVLALASLALAGVLCAQASAQEQSTEPSAREAQKKAACQQEANLIYRTSSRGVGLGEDTRNQIIAARRAHVRDCVAKAGQAPG